MAVGDPDRVHGLRPDTVVAHEDATARVAIVGAGIAGLILARALQRAGIEFVVFEKTDRVAGVWSAATHGCSTQESWRLYQLPEFPWPEELRATFSWDGLPPAASIATYLEAYAQRYGLQQAVRLKHEVLSLQPVKAGTGMWHVWSQTPTGSQAEVVFTHVAVCMGTFQVPRKLQLTGQEGFRGLQLCARDLTTDRLADLAGKRVVVLGCGKSAVDACAAAAEVAASTTMLFRKAYWWSPRFTFGLFHIDSSLASRWGLLFKQQLYYSDSALLAWAHWALKPLRLLFATALQYSLKWQYRLPPELVPEHSLADNTWQVVASDKEAFLQQLHAGRIQPLKGVVQQLEPDALLLADGRRVPAQVLVWAIGYDKGYACLAGLEGCLNKQPDGLHLYRNMIPVDLPSLAFISGEAVSVNTPLTAALQAEWWTRVLQGRVGLPRPEDMAAEVDRCTAWRRSFMPHQPSLGGKLNHLCQGYHDELVTDMGESKWRKGWAWMRELFGVYTVNDYEAIWQPSGTCNAT